MNPFLLFSTFLLLLFAQPEPPACVIASEQCKVLYYGTNNTLNILLREGVPTKVRSTNGMVREMNGSYTLKPDFPGTAVITVEAGKKTYADTFEVAQRAPIIQLGARFDNGDAATLKELSEQTTLTAFVGCCGMLEPCIVQRFTVLRLSESDGVETVDNQGAALSEGARGLLKKAQTGDKYVFLNVLCTLPGEKYSRDYGALEVTAQ